VGDRRATNQAAVDAAPPCHLVEEIDVDVPPPEEQCVLAPLYASHQSATIRIRTAVPSGD
jgi:hypothetical protein